MDSAGTEGSRRGSAGTFAPEVRVALVAFGIGVGLGLFFGAYWNESQQPERDDENWSVSPAANMKP